LFDTREELADAVNKHVPAAFLITANDIGKIERGVVRYPRATRREAMRKVLGASSDAEIGLMPAGGTTPAPAGLGVSVVVPSIGSHRSADQLRPLHVRPAVAYMPFLPAALDEPALRWLVAGDTDSPSVTGSTFVARPEDVDAATERLHELRLLDHRHGAGAVYPHVLRFLRRDVGGLLDARPADFNTFRRVRTVALGANELAGYQAVDLGADGLAQRHYLHALTLTGGDRGYGAYLLAVSLGHLALHCGYPRQALRMTQTAIMGASAAATPLVNAALHAVLARAFARLGEESSSTQAFRTAYTSLERSVPAAEPDWVRYLNAAYLADEAAHCFFDLGHHEQAQREVLQAMAGVGAGRVRRLAIDAALLASSLARSGQIDEACLRARQAADFARQTTSMRTVQRLAQLRTELLPYEGQRDVSDCLDYLHTVLPAAG
jgi:hypothetical protein